MDKKETFKAKGYWIENKPYSIDGHWDINYSDILSQLIKSAGKYCKRYASDLFIDWKAIDSLLEEGTPINRTWIGETKGYSSCFGIPIIVVFSSHVPDFTSREN